MTHHSKLPADSGGRTFRQWCFRRKRVKFRVQTWHLYRSVSSTQSSWWRSWSIVSTSLLLAAAALRLRDDIARWGLELLGRTRAAVTIASSRLGEFTLRLQLRARRWRDGRTGRFLLPLLLLLLPLLDAKRLKKAAACVRWGRRRQPSDQPTAACASESVTDRVSDWGAAARRRRRGGPSGSGIERARESERGERQERALFGRLAIATSLTRPK